MSDIPATAEDWTRSEDYQNSFLLPKDDILDAVQKNSAENGLRDIAVSANQGKFLNLIVKSLGVKRVLEIGTLGGYSAIWVARALPPDGKVITLEISEHVAKVAQENFSLAGVSDRISVVLGPAAETLSTLTAEEPFDLAFIDADKANVPTYFREAKRLVRKGGVIIVDNVIRYGQVGDLDYSDNDVEGIRTLLKTLKEDKDVEATTISTVGGKGYDGFLFALLK